MALEKLAFGLVATASDEKAAASFDAFAAWLREHAGLDVERRIAPTYQDLAASVREGSSDIAWLPPVVYAWIAEGVTALGSIVRKGRTSYGAALVVRADSELKTLEDLVGTRAGWVDPWSAAGFVVPRMELAKRGIEPSSAFRSEQFFGTHRDVLAALDRGDCDVAGTFASRPSDESPDVSGAWTEMRDVAVRVIATFGSIPTDVIAVRRNLSPPDYERTIEALRRASSDETARELTKAVFGGEALREGVEPGHDALRHAYERAVANGLFD